MAVAVKKITCPRKDPRQLCEEKKARILAATHALETQGSISVEDFLSKFHTALNKKKS